MSALIPIVAEIVEIAFFAVAAIITVLSLQRLPLSTWQKRSLLYAIVFSVMTKIVLALLGSNFDMASYLIVNDLVAHGRSVYANTSRYNYGPIWAWLVSGFGHLAAGRAGAFHVWIAAFLGAVDVIIALAIARVYTWTGAIVFLLSPLTLLISGFHSQFDNLAVLIALLGWLLIRSGEPKLPRLMASAALVGLSLVTKHILFLFPVWLLFWKPLGKVRHRVLYAGIAYGLFAVSFLPWIGDPASRAGILNNVFRYSSFYGNSLLGISVDALVSLESFDARLHWIPLVSGLKAVWMMLMFVAGITVARKGSRDVYLVYLMFLYASTPSLTDQYVVIPMLAAAVYCARWESWAFLIAGTLGLLASRYDIGSVFYPTMRTVTLAGHAQDLRQVLSNTVWEICMVLGQVFIAALLAKKWLEERQARIPEATAAVPDEDTIQAC